MLELFRNNGRVHCANKTYLQDCLCHDCYDIKAGDELARKCTSKGASAPVSLSLTTAKSVDALAEGAIEF